MFHKRIKEERELNKLTQKELAEKIDVTPATIGLYEQGRRTPDYNILVNIANILDVSTDYLLGRTDSKKEVLPIPAKGQALIVKAKGANVSIEELEAYIEARKKAQNIQD